MKTIDEALETFSFLIPRDYASKDEAMVALADLTAQARVVMERNAALVSEVNRSPIYKAMQESYHRLIASDCECEDQSEEHVAQHAMRMMNSALLSMFVNGMVVGMEMEKQDVVL